MADGTQSIGRALHILKAFDDHHPTWELAQLVEAVGLNKTTVFRILAALEAEGLIEKTNTGEYRLGSEMIAMGGRAARANPLREVASGHLRALARACGETTTLEIARRNGDSGGYMLVIDEVLGKHLVGITQYIGTRLPIHATSTGKALLAFLDDDARHELVTFPLPAFTQQTNITEAAFFAELDAICEDGYALAVGELEEGVVAIGAPVFDHNGNVTAAISMVGPSVRLNREQAHTLAVEVRETALRISHDIGYRALG